MCLLNQAINSPKGFDDVQLSNKAFLFLAACLDLTNWLVVTPYQSSQSQTSV